jgi:hypothetical protein
VNPGAADSETKAVAGRRLPADPLAIDHISVTVKPLASVFVHLVIERHVKTPEAEYARRV